MIQKIQKETEEEGIPTMKNRKSTHCFWGVHDFETIDTQTVLNTKGDEIGRIYILQCRNCGKIRSEHVRFYE